MKIRLNESSTKGIFELMEIRLNKNAIKMGNFAK